MEGTRIVLVRHGESLAQVEGFLGGHDACRGLSDRGRQQVEALRTRLAASGELADAHHLYTSLLPRAIETAGIIAPVVGGHDIVQECGFCEGHPGEADGMTFTELSDLTGGAAWSDDLRPVPGWETWSEMAGRVGSALDGVVERHPGETIVVACHGGVIVHAMLHYLGIEEADGPDRAWISPVNSSITEFRFAENPYRKQMRPVELVRFNDHAHLAGTDLVGGPL
jgi:probable phosphoglycerate mutase